MTVAMAVARLPGWASAPLPRRAFALLPRRAFALLPRWAFALLPGWASAVLPGKADASTMVAVTIGPPATVEALLTVALLIAALLSIALLIGRPGRREPGCTAAPVSWRSRSVVAPTPR